MLAIVGAAVMKASEDGPVAHLTRTDGAARLGVTGSTVAAVLSGIVLLASGWRLLIATVRRLGEERDWVGFGLLVLPLVLVVALMAEIVALAHNVDHLSDPDLWVAGWAASGVVAVVGSVWAVTKAVEYANPSTAPMQLVVPGAIALGVVAALALAAETLWLTRLTTLGTDWARMDGLFGVPLGWAAAVVIGATIAAGLLAALAATVINRALRAGADAPSPAS
jgi:hypothetical protein